MMRKIVWVILSFCLSLTLYGNVWSQAIMQPDEVTLRKWMDDYENAPRAFIDEVIHDRLNEAQAVGLGTSMNLLDKIQYVPNDRNQVSCGDCWVWASTGVMEIALDAQNGIKDRLSTQFLQSCKTDQYSCCGGNPTKFADWYRGKGFMIPWSNSSASFQDGSRSCENGSSLLTCGSISTTPNYPITSIQPVTITTTGADQSTAINNIKNVLHQNKGVYYAFWLANGADWDAFRNMWNNHGESTPWNPDLYCGHTWVDKEGGGHAVLIVGYNDDDPANPYWIVLNSWGTANGNRPNGLYRIPMYMNYDCTYYYPNANTNYYSQQFMTFDVAFNPQQPPPPSQKPNLAPYQPSGWSDKIVVSNVPGTYTDSTSLKSTDTLYVNFAYLNDSNVTINSKFYVDLYVDGVYMDSWYWNSLNAHYYGYLTEDYLIGSLKAGTHYIKMVMDSTEVINETNEGDNEYTKVITVGGNMSGADLSVSVDYTSFYYPSCGLSRSSLSCKISGIVEIDNLGNRDALSTYTEIYLYDAWLDNYAFLKRISTSKLKAGYYKTLRVSVNLPPREDGSGKYLLIVADADDILAEPDEDNNFLWVGPF